MEDKKVAVFGIYRGVSEAERGLCRVICFSPRHDLTLARMEPCARQFPRAA